MCAVSKNGTALMSGATKRKGHLSLGGPQMCCGQTRRQMQRRKAKRVVQVVMRAVKENGGALAYAAQDRQLDFELLKF